MGTGSDTCRRRAKPHPTHRVTWGPFLNPSRAERRLHTVLRVDALKARSEGSEKAGTPQPPRTQGHLHRDCHVPTYEAPCLVRRIR